MIIDVHTHIFPDSVIKNRHDYFLNEPDFKRLYENRHARLAGVSDLLQSMDSSGVDMSIALGFPWRQEKFFHQHNDMLIAASKLYPDRIMAFGCFDIRHPSAATEAKRCLSAGMSGIGELAMYDDDFSPAALELLAPVMDIALAAGVPVMFHTNEPVGHIYAGKAPMTLAGIESLVLRFPENKIILAHWGGGILFFHLMRKQMKDALKNVWVDTAASPFLYDPEVYDIASRILGPEKIVFGSDFPLIPPSRYFKDMSVSGLSQEDQNEISGISAARLLDLHKKNVREPHSS